MSDSLGDSTARLERLFGRIMKETDPAKCDELGAEIWQVLSQRQDVTLARYVPRTRNLQNS